MPAELSTTPVHWIAFLAVVLLFLALDLGVFHRQARVVSCREALCWTVIWASVAVAFGMWMAPAWITGWGKSDSVEFITGYLVELSLSMDNVFVIALIFKYFGVPLTNQHRVLFWGILGALIMRGVMIGAGAKIIEEFHWTLYALGAFLVFTGIKMLFAGEEEVKPEKNLALRLTRKLFPVSDHFDGSHFMTERGGRRMLTPLALVLVMVETTDLLFAVDSIPAIFAVTQKAYIVFTSNVFAILGLRSLYFVLASAIGYFRYLKFGLSIVLSIIGLKMLISKWYVLPTAASLLLVVSVLACSIIASMSASWREKQRERNVDSP